MQIITAIEPGSSGIPLEAVQGIEFASADEALLLIEHLGAFAYYEAQKASQKAPKGISEEAKRAKQLAARISHEVGKAPLS